MGDLHMGLCFYSTIAIRLGERSGVCGPGVRSPAKASSVHDLHDCIHVITGEGFPWRGKAKRALEEERQIPD